MSQGGEDRVHEERPSAAAGAPATSQGHDSATAEVPAST